MNTIEFQNASEGRTPSSETYGEVGATFSKAFPPVSDTANSLEASASAAWFYRFDSKTLEVRDTIGCYVLASLQVDQLDEDGDLSIVLVTQVRLASLEFLLLATSSQKDHQTALWLFDPFTLYTLRLPFDLGAARLTAAAVLDSDSLDPSIVILGSVSKFYIADIHQFTPSGGTTDAFQRLLTANTASTRKTTVSHVAVAKSASLPLFLIGTTNGCVELWRLGDTNVLENLAIVTCSSMSAVTHIQFIQGLLAVAIQPVEKEPVGPLVSIHMVSADCRRSQPLVTASPVTRGRVAALRLSRCTNGHRLWAAYSVQGSDYGQMLEVQSIEGDQVSLLVSEDIGGTQTDSVLDLDPIGDSLAVSLLAFNKLMQCNFGLIPLDEASVDQDLPKFTDWFSRDRRKFVYGANDMLNQIRKRRSGMGGLFFDMLLELCGIQGF